MASIFTVASLFLLPLIIPCQCSAPTTYYNILDFGAVAGDDGRTKSTNSLLKAWSSACASSNPSTIYVPQGRFLLKSQLHFKGPCANRAITWRIDGTLVAPSDYVTNDNNWLLLEGVDGIFILGGTLDAQGAALWACKRSDATACPPGATTLGIWNSKNVRISGLRSVNSEMFHIVINGCQDVELEGVQVLAPGDSPNTDGIHVQLSQRVAILNSQISTGDDCVSIGPGTTNLWIQNVACGPGHGISIGSLGKSYQEPGVQNVTVMDAWFANAQNGLRIKTWGRPSTGFVRDVLFQNVVMNYVQNPIVIDQNYCPDNDQCPGKPSGVGITGVTYRDIRGTSATQVAMKFDCSEAKPCQGIRLENVNLSYQNQAAQASCSNAAGTAAGDIRPSSCLY